MLRKKLVPGCDGVTCNALRYLLFTNLDLNAQPLRNKFVIYGAEAVLMDFNGNCGLQNATPYIPDLVHAYILRFCECEDPRTHHVDKIHLFDYSATA